MFYDAIRLLASFDQIMQTGLYFLSCRRYDISQNQPLRFIMTQSAAQIFTQKLGITVPVIGGAMFPCSNPELVAAVSAAGGIGVVQPVSLTFVHGHDFAKGLQYINSLAGNKPIGMNLLIEKSSQSYLEKNKRWLDVALEAGVKFFITALGNPDWVVERVKGSGALVFHDVTERKWADKALDANVDGLICVNNRAGGHAGSISPEKLFLDLKDTGKLLICAGGIGSSQEFIKALKIGYAGVQMGTRFIATKECTAHHDYKAAILKAHESDIVLTKKLTGVPVSVIRTPYVDALGTEPNNFIAWMLRHPKLKHYARMYYTLSSALRLKKSLKQGDKYQAFYQAGKSVDSIKELTSAGSVIQDFYQQAKAAGLM